MLKPQSTMDDFKSKFRLISREIGKDWHKLGRWLLLNDAELENISIQNIDLEDKSYKMLCLWLERQKSPTHDALVSALEQARRLDLIEMIKPSTASIFY